jgi:glycosyltransferase involved in cell wall biosynthesis
MACPHYWTSPFQLGGHHLGRAFAAAGWDVAYISNPISWFHRLKGGSGQLDERRRIHDAGGLTDLDGHLWTYVPLALLTPHNAPILRTPWVHDHWHRLTATPLKTVLAERGFERVDLLYIDTVVQRFWLDAVDHRKSVQRIGDRMSGFSAFTGRMLELEGEIARSVDLVAYTSSGLEPHVRSLGARRWLHLPNGVEVSHFTDGPRDVPDDLSGIRRPIAIYVGAMDEWFDFHAVETAAIELPGVSFVLIGPDSPARDRLATLPNLHLLGPRPFVDLPRYLHNSDVGLIPFDVAGHTELVNDIHPLKLYEYLACGLPVVATRWRELERLASPALLVDDGGAIAGAISHALDRPPDRDASIRFATAADWSGRLQVLLGALGWA